MLHWHHSLPHHHALNLRLARHPRRAVECVGLNSTQDESDDCLTPNVWSESENGNEEAPLRNTRPKQMAPFSIAVFSTEQQSGVRHAGRKYVQPEKEDRTISWTEPMATSDNYCRILKNWWKSKVDSGSRGTQGTGDEQSKTF